MSNAPEELIRLAQWMGDPANEQCLLAEGNVSCRGADGTVWIKASGSQMGSIESTGFLQVRSDDPLAAMDEPPAGEDAVRAILDGSRLDQGCGQKPSTETFMHVYLLGLEGVRFVAHGHPPALLSVLCLERPEEFATKRLFPDEIVCSGVAACFVPYVAPGLPLAIEIRQRIAEFEARYGRLPKAIWLQNHGLIALGETAAECESICAMSTKAAQVLLDALQTGSPIRWLTDEEIHTISDWPDEHYRQQRLRDR